MRFFIALDIPKENIQQFKAIQQKVQKLIPNCRLTDLEKLHLTFAFIGDQHAKIKDSLIHVLHHSAEGISPFSITPAYIDGFPNIHQPRVIWLGIKGDIDRIIILRERIKDGLAELQLDTDERRFIPHITIAKLNNEHEISLETEEKLQQITTDAFTPMRIKSIQLFESIPYDGFHEHNTLAEILLQ